ncbi:hypothetical protein K491DRAFT_697267 [Lophiostoma macrostomum CBS 122681]|uniref:Mid2 domain-containing protein n=1 Tax=Lophiostoma macrostomum CBS 122681 TaxID=1314788 RepID=A0A6A6SUY7_9PLEO|nr:hypothetical protein K491DRAFT_697267 [Lophiostoma macrostomum CBS 122681]
MSTMMPGATATPSTSASTSTPTPTIAPTTSAASVSKSGGSANIGAIVGGVIRGLAVVGGIILGAIYLLRRQRTNVQASGTYDDQMKSNDPNMAAPAYYSPRTTSPRSWTRETGIDRYSGMPVYEVQPG